MVHRNKVAVALVALAMTACTKSVTTFVKQIDYASDGALVVTTCTLSDGFNETVSVERETCQTERKVAPR